MELVGHTALQYENTSVNYEILRMGKMLIFKPFFSHLENTFPHIFLSFISSEWKLTEQISSSVESQIREDIASLQIHRPGRFS